MKKNRNYWSVLLLISTVILLLYRFLVPIIFNNEKYSWYHYDENGMMWGDHMTWRNSMGYWMIVPTILILLILFSLYKIFISTRYKNDDVLDHLKKRYAKGEITEEEYIQKKKILNDK